MGFRENIRIQKPPSNKQTTVKIYLTQIQYFYLKKEKMTGCTMKHNDGKKLCRCSLKAEKKVFLAFDNPSNSWICFSNRTSWIMFKLLQYRLLYWFNARMFSWVLVLPVTSWWHWLCYLACAPLFCSTLHMTSYPTGSVSEVGHHAAWCCWLAQIVFIS